MKKFKKSEYIIYYIFSCLFAFTIFMKKEIGYSIDSGAKFIKDFQFNLFFFIKILICGILILGLIIFLFHILDKIKIVQKSKEISNKKIFIISFVSIFLSGLLYRLVFFPGSGFNDTLYIISDPVGMSVQHPLLYNLVIGYTYRIFFSIFQSNNLAYFSTSICQLLFMTLIIAIIICWFNKTFKNAKYSIILILYYSLLPIISSYNSALIKDSIYNALFLLDIPILYTIIVTKAKCIKDNKILLLFTIILSLSTFVRNNSIYVLIILLITIMFIYKKYFKRLGIMLILIILISKAPMLLVLNRNDLTPLFKEKIAVPLSQLTYTIYTNGEIGDDEQNYLNKLLPLETYKNNYNPYFIDSIKWNKNFNTSYLNETKTEFLKVWFNTLPNNLEGYIKSYFLLTYNYWAIEKFNPNQSVFFELDLTDSNSLSRFKDPKLCSEQILPNFIQNPLEKFYKSTAAYINMDTCVWLIILYFLYTIHKKKQELIILSLPLIGTWFTIMISTPVSFAFRYFSLYIYLVPIVLLISLLYKKPE